MIEGARIAKLSGTLSNGTVRVSIAFHITDQAEFARIEQLKDTEQVVSIDIQKAK